MTFAEELEKLEEKSYFSQKRRCNIYSVKARIKIVTVKK